LSSARNTSASFEAITPSFLRTLLTYNSKVQCHECFLARANNRSNLEQAHV
jgi:hypothetical protein